MKILQTLGLILGLAVFANAQKTILSGTVYDANGARIVKSKVTAVNQKGEKLETFTNDEGIYTLNLTYNPYQPGSFSYRLAKYDITVEAFGFENFTLKDFKVTGGYNDKMQLDFALDVLTYTQPITVVPTENKNQNKYNKRKINK